MKIRAGFVSNSSSSSFVAFIPVQFFDELFSLFINMRFEGEPPSEKACVKLKKLIRKHLDTAHSVLGEFMTYTACSDAGGTSVTSFGEGEDDETFVDEYNAIVLGKKESAENKDSEEDVVYEDDDDYDSDALYDIVSSFEDALESMSKDGKVLSCGTEM